MVETSNDPGSAASCPICGGAAETGCLYGPDGGWGLRWLPGEPRFLGNMMTGFGAGFPVGDFGPLIGTHARGLRCKSCRRIILAFTLNEAGPGLELISRASDLESEGNWDQAIALYRRVLAEPEYRDHHDYARNSIEAIEDKKRRARGD